MTSLLPLFAHLEPRRPAVVVLSDGPGLARSSDPATSKAAAALLKDRGSTHARIYRFLLDRVLPFVAQFDARQPS